MKRSEIDNQYKWNLHDIFESDEAWEKGFSQLQAMMPQIADLKQGFTDSAAALAAALQKIDEASLLCERLFVYARMSRDQDNGNTTYQAMTDRAMSLYVALGGETSFVAPTLLKADEAVLERYIEEEPGLADHTFMIRDVIRQKQHVLGESEEKLLSLSADFAEGAKDIFTMLNNVDLKFGSITKQGEVIGLTHAQFIVLMQDKDRQVRKDAFDTYYSAYRGSINTIAAAYSTSVKKDVFYSKAREYDSALHKALFADNVPVSLYDGLIDAVHAALPTMHDYVSARKQILKLDDIAMYDVYAPLVEDADEKYSFEQAMDLILTALEPMGGEYLGLLKTAQNEKWIDVFENDGKTSGAYSWGAYGTHPYVLLNHRGDLDSVYTIAHELGHAMHTHYSQTAQPFALASYTIFVAEVASTVNELLLTHHLLKTATGSLRKYVLNHYLDQFRTTVLRQTMFAEFERISHRMYESGEPLTQQSLSDQYAQLNRLYYGGEMKTCDTIALEWARVPHFYRAFYVYKYATGFSAAVMIAQGISEGRPGVLEAYKEFLQSGGSDYPLNLLQKAGVDFDGAAPVKVCMQAFADALAEFKQVMQIS